MKESKDSQALKNIPQSWSLRRDEDSSFIWMNKVFNSSNSMQGRQWRRWHIYFQVTHVYLKVFLPPTFFFTTSQPFIFPYSASFTTPTFYHTALGFRLVSDLFFLLVIYKYHLLYPHLLGQCIQSLTLMTIFHQVIRTLDSVADILYLPSFKGRGLDASTHWRTTVTLRVQHWSAVLSEHHQLSWLLTTELPNPYRSHILSMSLQEFKSKNSSNLISIQDSFCFQSYHVGSVLRSWIFTESFGLGTIQQTLFL